MCTTGQSEGGEGGAWGGRIQTVWCRCGDLRLIKGESTEDAASEKKK